MNESDKPVIFISCGQYTDRERRLGHDICKVIQEIRPDLEPYFAQNQSTLEGLSDNILKALHSAAGFICVMHERGKILHDEEQVAPRGSVWIEQEIAIAAFMTHALGRSVPILFYKAPAVSLQGIRSVLHLNPRVEFTDEDEVLADLRQVLPQMKFEPHAELDLEPEVNYEKLTSTPERHEYQLTVKLRNVGTMQVTDFAVEVHFPKRFLASLKRDWTGNPKWFTDTHACFEKTHEWFLRNGKLFYPETDLKVFELPYFVDKDLYRSGALQDAVTVVVRSGGMKP